MNIEKKQKKKKILIVSNDSPTLFLFRKELISNLVSKKYDVYVSVPYSSYTEKLRGLGTKIIDTKLSRRSINPISNIALFVKYYFLLFNMKPDIILTYTVKPNIFVGIIASKLKMKYIVNITGLGTSIKNNGILSKVILYLYKVSIKNAQIVFFQNNDDKNYFVKHKIISNNYDVLPGSGINLEEYTYKDYPIESDSIFLIFIGRIMKNKGIDEFLSCVEYICKKYNNVKFGIFGYFDEKKYERVIKGYEDKHYLKYYGYKDNIADYISLSNAIFHPSHHEGMSNVLLEAQACGRPVLASNVPGCIETFENGVTGFAFDYNNIDDICSAVEKFINLPYESKREMGIKGRERVKKLFNRNIVIKKYIDQINLVI